MRTGEARGGGEEAGQGGRGERGGAKRQGGRARRQDAAEVTEWVSFAPSNHENVMEETSGERAVHQWQPWQLQRWWWRFSY